MDFALVEWNFISYFFRRGRVRRPFFSRVIVIKSILLKTIQATSMMKRNEDEIAIVIES